jgi:hypothetical protein
MLMSSQTLLLSTMHENSSDLQFLGLGLSFPPLDLMRRSTYMRVMMMVSGSILARVNTCR